MCCGLCIIVSICVLVCVYIHILFVQYICIHLSVHTCVTEKCTCKHTGMHACVHTHHYLLHFRKLWHQEVVGLPQGPQPLGEVKTGRVHGVTPDRTHVSKTGNTVLSLHKGAELACRWGQRITRHWNIKFHLICSNTELCAGNRLPCRNSLASPISQQRGSKTHSSRDKQLSKQNAKGPWGLQGHLRCMVFPLAIAHWHGQWMLQVPGTL